MIDPNQILSDKRARVAELEALLSVEKAELRGMEQFASAFEMLAKRQGAATLRIPSRTTRLEEARTGRQPGSISKKWRVALWHLDEMGGDFSAQDIVNAVHELEGRALRPADAKRQMDTYAEHGFISEANGVYNVTDDFRSKFAEFASGSNENGAAEAAPDAEEVGASSTDSDDDFDSLPR